MKRVMVRRGLAKAIAVGAILVAGSPAPSRVVADEVDKAPMPPVVASIAEEKPGDASLATPAAEAEVPVAEGADSAPLAPIQAVDESGEGDPIDRVDGCESASGRIDPGSDADFWTHDFVAGQPSSVRAMRTSGDLDGWLSLYNPAGVEIAYNDDGGGDRNPRIDFVPASTGTYRIRVSSYMARSTGDYLIEVCNGTATTPDTEDGTYLSSGQTAVGRIDPASDRDSFYFDSLGSGQLVTLRMNGDSGLDSFLRLYNASGAEIASNDDGGGSRNALIQGFALASEGRYRVEAQSYAGGSSGNYSLRLDLSTVFVYDPEGDVLRSGQSVSRRIDPATDQDTFYFDANAGNVITLRMDGQGDLDSFLRLYNPSGSEIASNDDGGGNRDALIADSRVPTSGRYRVVAHSYASGSSGDYSLRFDMGATPADCNAGANGVILYEHPNQQGRCVTFTSDGYDFTTIGFNDVASAIRFAGTYASGWEAVLYEHTGYNGGSETFRTNDSDFGDNWIGHDRASSIQLRRIDQDSEDGTVLRSGQTFAGQINPTTDRDTFYFDASAGQHATLRMDGDGSLDSYLNLYSPAGSQIASNDDGAGNRDALIDDVALQSSGRYRVEAYSYNLSSAGPYRLRLDLANATSCSGTPITFGQTVSGYHGGAATSYCLGASREWVTIRMFAEGSPTTFDPWLHLYDGTQEIAQNDDEASGYRNAFISIRLPRTQFFRISADRYGSVNGRYLLRVDRGRRVASADVTSDCAVNTIDLVEVQDRLGTSDPYGDINLDGFVNTFDLLNVQDRLGTLCPEPYP